MYTSSWRYQKNFSINKPSSKEFSQKESNFDLFKKPFKRGRKFMHIMNDDKTYFFLTYQVANPLKPTTKKNFIHTYMHICCHIAANVHIKFGKWFHRKILIHTFMYCFLQEDKKGAKAIFFIYVMFNVSENKFRFL